MMLATSFLLMAAVWTITVIGAALAPMEETSNPSSVSNLKCMFYDNVSMNCTWDINKQAPPDAQYDLYYMLQYTNERKYCKSYLTHGRRKGACHVEKYKLQPIDDATICVADSRPNLMKPYCKDITPLTFYEVGPPMNIKETESHIEWEPPRGKHPLNDFIYQIQIADGSNYVKAEIETVDVEKWNIRNQLKSYSLRVRTRIKNYISRSPWSAWSESVNIEQKQKPKENTYLKISIAIAVTFVVVLLVLMFLCRRFKLFKSLCQPIPDPKKKFNGLFDSTSGDFQKWINVDHPVTKDPEECVTITVED